MAPEEKSRLLALHRANSLTASERAQLMEAGLADQEIFDAVMDSQVFASIREDPSFSREVRYALRPKPAWYRRPLVWSVLAGAAALALVLILQPWPGRQLLHPANYDLPATMLSAPAAGGAEFRGRLMRLPPGAAIGGSLSLNKTSPAYRKGESLRVQFQAAADANALLLESRADGTVLLLFPNRFVSLPSVRAGEAVRVPPPGQGDMRVEGPAGVRRLRLILVPRDVDVFSSAAVDLADREKHISVIDRSYTVE